MTIDKDFLMRKAIEARNNAYTPYSKFKVGAAMLLKNGTIYTGCNIENASYGLCICAERNCLFKAYSEGVKKDDIIAFAVAADTPKACSPCGACRQVMSELMHKDTPVYLTNLNGDVLETTVEGLLPYFFVGEDMQNA